VKSYVVLRFGVGVHFSLCCCNIWAICTRNIRYPTVTSSSAWMCPPGIVSSHENVYLQLLAVQIMCSFYRDGDYENIFTDLSRFPEILKEKLVSL
jgi:hypothetical protein